MYQFPTGEKSNGKASIRTRDPLIREQESYYLERPRHLTYCNLINSTCDVSYVVLTDWALNLSLQYCLCLRRTRLERPGLLTRTCMSCHDHHPEGHNDQLAKQHLLSLCPPYDLNFAQVSYRGDIKLNIFVR